MRKYVWKRVMKMRKISNWLSISYSDRVCRMLRLSDLSRGFTIIEVLIVVVILSIAAFVAIPMVGSAASMQIRSASNMIAADLEYARSMAISRGQNYSVVFDAATDRYWIEDQYNTVISHPVKKGFDYVVDFKSDGRLGKVDIIEDEANNLSRVTFDYFGSPSEGGDIDLAAGDSSITIDVEDVTGFITISNL